MRDFYLKPKFFETLKTYTKSQLLNDIIAGIIVAIIALPLSIALAIVLLLVVMFLMPCAKLIPMPTIAAILFIVAYNMSEWHSFVKIIKQKNVTDIIIMVLTFVLTVVFDLVVAIIIGLALHFVIMLVKRFRKKA
ncbi:MAG: hypothetical protein IKJ93_01965 [Clostridia bacterium]|nr:hypothetical protein [Clostridia bacterium]